MFHTSLFKRSIALAMLGIFFAGCGASNANTPAVATVVPSRPTVAPPTATTVASIPTTAAPSPSESLLGAYDNSKTPHDLETLTLLDGGRYSLQVQGDDIPITGTWAISAEQIVFTEAAGGGDCPDKPGTYKFTVDGKALTFSKVQDPYCDLRVEDFTSGPWIKKP